MGYVTTTYSNRNHVIINCNDVGWSARQSRRCLVKTMRGLEGTTNPGKGAGPVGDSKSHDADAAGSCMTENKMFRKQLLQVTISWRPRYDPGATTEFRDRDPTDSSTTYYCSLLSHSLKIR